MSEYITASDLASNPTHYLSQEVERQYGEGNSSINIDDTVSAYDDNGEEIAVFSSNYTTEHNARADFSGHLVGEDLDYGEKPSSTDISISLTPEHMVDDLEKADELDPDPDED